MSESVVQTIHLAERDELLDPLALASIVAWAERIGFHRNSRKKPRYNARSVVELVRWLWPSIEVIEGTRSLELHDPDAPFRVTVGEDRATISILRTPADGEPRFERAIVQALCRRTGWLAYDPNPQDIIDGVHVRCDGCGAWFGVRAAQCPDCRAPAREQSLVWLEPTSIGPSNSPELSMELSPLLWHYGLSASVLSDEHVASIEAELARVVSETLGGAASFEVSISRGDEEFTRAIFEPIDTELDSMLPEHAPRPDPMEQGVGRYASANLTIDQCVTVVDTVTDAARQVAHQSAIDAFGDADIGDELMFTVGIGPDSKERAEQNDQQYGFLPHSLWQPGLARPLWTSLRTVLGEIASQVQVAR